MTHEDRIQDLTIALAFGLVALGLSRVGETWAWIVGAFFAWMTFALVANWALERYKIREELREMLDEGEE
jgi:hypothetical protein